MERICSNCKHFDFKHPVMQIEGINVCRCLSKYSSLEPEVGSRIHIVLVSEFCNCTMHGNAFEPAGEYQAWLADTMAQNDTRIINESTIPACYL